MEKETKKRIENVEDNLDKVMLENRELDQRVEKLETKESFENHFIKGIITKTGMKSCSKCEKIFEQGKDVYTDGSQINYHLCKKCYLKLEGGEKNG